MFRQKDLSFFLSFFLFSCIFFSCITNKHISKIPLILEEHKMMYIVFLRLCVVLFHVFCCFIYMCVTFYSHSYFVSLMTVSAIDYSNTSGAPRVVLYDKLDKYFPLLPISLSYIYIYNTAPWGLI